MTLNHDDLLNSWKFICIITQILVYEKHDFMSYKILNNEPLFKGNLKHSMNLTNAVLYKKLFLFSRYLSFCLDFFLSGRKMTWLERKG